MPKALIFINFHAFGKKVEIFFNKRVQMNIKSIPLVVTIERIIAKYLFDLFPKLNISSVITVIKKDGNCLE